MVSFCRVEFYNLIPIDRSVIVTELVGKFFCEPVYNLGVGFEKSVISLFCLVSEGFDDPEVIEPDHPI